MTSMNFCNRHYNVTYVSLYLDAGVVCWAVKFTVRPTLGKLLLWCKNGVLDNHCELYKTGTRPTTCMQKSGAVSTIMTSSKLGVSKILSMHICKTGIRPFTIILQDCSISTVKKRIFREQASGWSVTLVHESGLSAFILQGWHKST